jgi:signal transduction histidine kinase
MLAMLLSAGAADAQSTIKVGVSQRDLGAMDPAFGIGNGDEFPIRQVFNVLVGPKDGTTNLKLEDLQGELAERWEMAPDARSFTFHLRKGVQWHRGYGEVTAADVAFTIQRMQDPKTGTAYGSNFRDITAVELAEAMRRDFVANVSHELKTPVGALSLLAEAVQAADTDIEQVRHFTSRMQIEVQRLTAMIADLVALSQVQGDAPLRNSVPVDVQSIISEAVDSTKIAAEQKQISVTIGDASEAAEVFGDEPQLVTALSNLISNAIRYSPTNTRVGVGVRTINDMVEISVTDQGPGIPSSDVERIFERFYRIDPARSRDTGGTGLGLAIVKHVCANHGGECVVWSELGQGSTFTLRFPAYLNGSANLTEVTVK